MTSAQYLQLSGYLGEYYLRGAECLTILDRVRDILDETQASQNPRANQSILAVLSTTENRVTQKYVDVASRLYTVVSTLQRAAIAESGSVEAYLDANNLLVTPAFAELSYACGWVINPWHIQPNP